jgi:hypothetical protein
VITELAKSDDDAVKLALSLNKNLDVNTLTLIRSHNPLRGYFMGKFNNSVALLSSGLDLGVTPVIVARPTFEAGEVTGFELIEGFSAAQFKGMGGSTGK